MTDINEVRRVKIVENPPLTPEQRIAEIEQAVKQLQALVLELRARVEGLEMAGREGELKR